MDKLAPQARTGAVAIREDQRYIAGMIEPGARVLDVGCGEGELLHFLVHEKDVIGRGIELSREGVTACFHLGLSVIQGDAEADLKDYPAESFDYVILSQTLQTIHGIRSVVDDLLRIGRRAIVSVPNFGHWLVRWRLLITGRAPMTPTLHHAWYDTPNIRICSMLDMMAFCEQQNIRVEQMLALSAPGALLGRQIDPGFGFAAWLANLRAAQGLFLLSRQQR